MPLDSDTLRKGLALTLGATHLEGPPPRGLGTKYEGKVRDNYVSGDGRRILVTTDRISAFDRVLGTLPFKGQLLNELSAWWFEQTRDIAPNHVLEIPDPNVMVGIDCRPLEVELVVRAYLTGVTSTSIWTHYEQGARVAKSRRAFRKNICARGLPAKDGRGRARCHRSPMMCGWKLRAAMPTHSRRSRGASSCPIWKNRTHAFDAI